MVVHNLRNFHLAPRMLSGGKFDMVGGMTASCVVSEVIWCRKRKEVGRGFASENSRFWPKNWPIFGIGTLFAYRANGKVFREFKVVIWTTMSSLIDMVVTHASCNWKTGIADLTRFLSRQDWRWVLGLAGHFHLRLWKRRQRLSRC